MRGINRDCPPLAGGRGTGKMNWGNPGFFVRTFLPPACAGAGSDENREVNIKKQTIRP